MPPDGGCPISKITDRNYLTTEQYASASNLETRIELHARFSTNRYGWHRWVFDQLNLGAECRILELGCGPGDLWLENRERIPAGWDITLSDLSSGMLEQAKSNLRNAQRRFRLAAIDAQAIPFADASFDGVIANHMLYHVPDRSQALAELRRVLRPGGRFYTSTVGRNHLREMAELVSRFSPGAEFWQERERADAFALETGAEQLCKWFTEVTVYRYDDGLVITEAQPLVAYILSSWSSAAVGDRVAEFTAFVRQKITADGAIRVHKDSGMFACTRA